MKARIMRQELEGCPTAANDNIHPDETLRLADAVRYGFPHGGMTVSGLRREAERGRLVIERIANKDFTTLRAIEEKKQCRVEAQGRTSGCEKTVAKAGSSSHARPGSSSTMEGISPRDAMLARLGKRKAA
jgi:hypothetical protein